MIDEKILLKALRGFYEREQEYKLVSDEKGIHYEPQTGLIDEIIKYVQKMPKVGEWIPCSERLPEKTSSYLVTTIAADAFGKPYYVMDVALYNIVYGWTLNNKKCEEIFAWRPLPEPWEGEAAAESQKEEE